MLSTGHLVAGDVAGATVLLLDDLIAAGNTMQLGAAALRRAGARAVVAFAAHGLFVGSAAQTLASHDLSRLIVTDSMPPFRLPESGPVRDKLQIASVVPQFAEAVSASHAAWAHHGSSLHVPLQEVQGGHGMGQVPRGLG